MPKTSDVRLGCDHSHPRTLSRRAAIQAGAISLLGLGTNHLQALRLAHADGSGHRPRACIFIFLSGGLAQLDSFDLKPHAPESIRGEFTPIAARTPGIEICEHLPRLAVRSELWSLCRSLTHSSNEHSAGHLFMLTGRSELPPGFSPSKPKPDDWPSITSVAGAVTTPRHNLPPAVMLPDRIVHNSGRVIPGQFAGQMGEHRDPWIIEAAPFHSRSYGAFPEYAFDHQERGAADDRVFEAPNLSLAQGLTRRAFSQRLNLLGELERQRQLMDRAAHVRQFDQDRQAAISLLNDPSLRRAFDVTNADDRTQDRYGRNSFGWSLLMARRLIESGVNLIQVNLGNDETWDTHGNAFPHLKNKLFPPTDRAVSALLDDLHASGQLDDTLVVMASEFGRTPKTSRGSAYDSPGRDHWGAVQTVFFAGGGVQGGRVIGPSDPHGGYPNTDPQRPENMAATIYQSLGIPKTAVWKDALDRPHHVYHGEPIAGLT